jgi:dipeptidyl aminopeptidase/acylaminoacyl peptidase
MLVHDRNDQSDVTEEFPIAPHSAATKLFESTPVEEYLTDPATGLLLGGQFTGEKGFVLFDTKLQRRLDAARKAFAAYQFTLESYSSNMAKMVVKTDGGDDPGTFWLIDMATGKAEDLMSAYPDVDPKDVGPTRMFAYTAADGLPLEGVLTLPAGSTGRNLPLVMMPHGGPFDVYDRVGFDWWAQAFASRGYAVFQPNYRGSGGHGVAFEDKGHGEWGRGMLSDMADGITALAKAGIVDPTRACIVGASYGGYAALAGVTIQHGLYRCAVSYAGVSDVGHAMARDGTDSETAEGRFVEKMFGVKDPYDPALRKISPLRNAGAADAPILLIHGKDDTRVPIVNSLSMKSALELARKPVEMVTLTGEDHFLSREASRVQTLEASVAFVEKYNPAAPPAVAAAR